MVIAAMLRWAAIGLVGLACVACGSESDRSPPTPGPPSPVPNGSGAASGTDGASSGGPAPTTFGSPTGSSSGGTATETGTQACDPFDIISCGATDRCSPVDGRCYPDGTGPLDAACSPPDPMTGLDSCRRGLSCAFADDETARCVTHCDPAGAPCDDGVCVVDPQSAVGWCLQTCDPFAFECNRSGDACYPMPGAVDTVMACAPVGIAELDELCGESPDCQRGLACTAAEVHASNCLGLGGSCCASFCNGIDAACFGNDLECLPIGLKETPALGICGTTPP